MFHSHIVEVFNGCNNLASFVHAVILKTILRYNAVGKAEWIIA